MYTYTFAWTIGYDGIVVVGWFDLFVFVYIWSSEEMFFGPLVSSARGWKLWEKFFLIVILLKILHKNK